MTGRIRVLGAVDLDTAAGDAVLGRWPRVRRLLAVLVVHVGEVVSVDRLGEVLWGGEVPTDPPSAVHNLVSRLRAAVRAAGAADSVRVVTRAPGYLLDIDPAALDSTRFTRLVEAARARLTEAPGAAADLLDQALALWHGPAFAGFTDEEFARTEVARLTGLRQAAAADRAEADVVLGRYDEAIGRLEPMLAAEPLRERLLLLLMRALHGAGRSVEALAEYRDYRTALVDELGLDPSPQLRDLEAAIIRQDPAIRTVARASRPRHNLPQERGELVGRSADAARVIGAVQRDRLVTLTGVGGVGKTRLALHVATGMLADHPDGVWLCELAPVGEDAVGEIVATALGVRPRHGLGLAECLAEDLRGKRLVLVLDNCEHVTAAVGRLVDTLLRHCSQMRVLATSREPLEVDGEQVLPVTPLPTPARTAGLDAVARAEAVRLFVQRATAASPLFALTSANAPDVAEICRRLDGLPLALELVAPKVRAISPAEIVTRLDRRLRFVRTASRVIHARHRTLHAVVDWSYQLLDEPHRAVFDRVSVFVGSFTVDAAEAVAGRVVDRADLADMLATLVDRSMLDARPDRSPTRYSMLETLRHFGRDRLVARGWDAGTRRDHAVHHVEVAVAAAAGLTGPDPGRWMTVLDRHLDDLRAAHGWTVTHDPDLAMRLCAALFWYLEPGMLTEATTWTQRSIAAAPPDHPLLPMVTYVAAFGATKVGDLAAATRLARRGLAMSDTRDPIRRYGQFVLGDVALFEGRLDEAGRCYAEAAQLAQDAGDAFTHAYAVANLVLPLAYRGEHARAVAAAHRGRAAAATSGSPHLVAWADYALGEALADADPEQALAALDAALAVARRSGSRFIEGVALVSAASLRARHGDPGDALDLFATVVQRWHHADNWTQQWTTLRNVVDLFVRLAADETAVVLSAALRASGSAAPLFGSDAARLAETDASLRARVPEQAYRRCAARGAGMTDDEAVSFAIAEIDRLRAVAG